MTPRNAAGQSFGAGHTDVFVEARGLGAKPLTHPHRGKDELEIGWSVLGVLWGRGYATGIGRIGLAFAFQELDAERVAFTETHTKRSRAVMERLGMRCR